MGNHLQPINTTSVKMKAEQINISSTELNLYSAEGYQCDIQCADFFQYASEVNGWHHSPDSKMVCIPETLPAFDRKRQEPYTITNRGEFYAYDQFFRVWEVQREDELYELLNDYITSSDATWYDPEDEYEEINLAITQQHERSLVA